MANVTYYSPPQPTWDPTWNGNALGTTNKVTNELKYKRGDPDSTPGKPRGKMVLGHWDLRLMGLVRTELPADVGPRMVHQHQPLRQRILGSCTRPP